MRWLTDLEDRIREHTLCRLGIHSRRSRCVKKFDGGRLPLLCRHCRLIIGRWTP